MSYKILSLDGGGSWALIQARVLADLYPGKSGHEVLRQFDLAIANSGGALVLACLCCDIAPAEIVAIFQNETARKKVFAPLKPAEFNLLSFARSVFKNFPAGARYSARRKREGLVEVLSAYDDRPPGQKIVQSPLRSLPKIIGKENLQLLIVGFDYFRERATFFRSNHQSKTDKYNSRYYDVTLGDAIHASSNAPVNYFQEYAEVRMECKSPPEAREIKKNWYWDGAVAGFNNPVLAGLIEAITNEPGRPLEDFKVLSIGTGQTGKAVIPDLQYSNNPLLRQRWEKNKDKPFVLADDSVKFQLEIGKLAQSILGDPPDSASFIAAAILDRALSGSSQLVRINPCIMPRLDKLLNEYVLPAAYAGQERRFLEVLALDMDAVEDAQVAMIAEVADKFITEGILPNQYIRGEGDSSQKLGFGSYREAKDAWQAMV